MSNNFIKKSTIILATLLFTVLQGAFAQRTITGKVIDENEQGIPGASVVVKGTTTGMSTDANGNFTLNVPNDATIVVSFIGYKTVEIPVETQTLFNVTLETDVNVLGDVVVRETRNLVIPPERAVVTPWGVRDKNTLTTSIATISGDIIRNTGNTNFMAVLDGRIPGVTLITGGGAGGRTIIQELRGVKAWARGSQPPLFVIDGLPMAMPLRGIASGGAGGGYIEPSNDISDIIAQINPEDIEDITIIRGQEGVTRWGSDAANGVVIINLKKR